MSSTFETGHAKNVANFENLISFCKDYGGDYNPSKASLTIPKLAELLELAQKELGKTKSAKTGFDNSTNSRRIAFEDLKPFSTKVINALAVSGASDLAVQDAKAINRKIQGFRSEKTETLPCKRQLTLFPPNLPWYSICHSCGSI